jgi:hypothetical protein
MARGAIQENWTIFGSIAGSKRAATTGGGMWMEEQE